VIRELIFLLIRHIVHLLLGFGHLLWHIALLLFCLFVDSCTVVMSCSHWKKQKRSVNICAKEL
jgi:hypothetical protein